LTFGDNYNWIRVLVVQDYEYETLAPTLFNILPNTGGNNMVSTYNTSNVSRVIGTNTRFKVLYDKVHLVMSDDSSVSSGGAPPSVVKEVTFKNLGHLKFLGDPISTNYSAKGHIYLMAISDSIILNHPILSAEFTLSYKDA